MDILSMHGYSIHSLLVMLKAINFKEVCHPISFQQKPLKIK